MRKVNTLIISGLLLGSFGFGGILGVNQNASAATDSAARQKQLEEWQQKLADWQKAQQSAAQSKSSSSTKRSARPSSMAPSSVAVEPTDNSAALPNTGPGQVIALFAVTTATGTVMHYALRRQQVN